MKKTVLQIALSVLLLGLFPVVTSAQEKSKSSLFNVSFRTGIASYEIENNSKSVSVNYGAYFLKEFEIGSKSVINTGLGVNNFLFDFQNANGQSINAQNTFIELPVGYKRYSYNQDRDKAFVTEIGIINRLKVNEEYTSFPDVNIEKDLGYNLGAIVGLGYHTSIYDYGSLEMGLILATDFLNSGYDNSNIIDNQVSLYFTFKFLR
ncbi:hypothetical protein LX97_00453 [Nonlabens dokdonensis]|uniref:Outer membrane protein beta-barrel domain-containing protein n=3 Tax=Nonlabens dokdonensis TaxID=328515 RepID=L7W7L7_NONDD|nr:hypothetical protein DDD_0644 [Nonlabens dokdonensis DSW-6]PZX43453.1 hypothetical protein LX97_00453 [Nonlabens dokdonensis]